MSYSCRMIGISIKYETEFLSVSDVPQFVQTSVSSSSRSEHLLQNVWKVSRLLISETNLLYKYRVVLHTHMGSIPICLLFSDFSCQLKFGARQWREMSIKRSAWATPVS